MPASNLGDAVCFRNDFKKIAEIPSKLCDVKKYDRILDDNSYSDVKHFKTRYSD